MMSRRSLARFALTAMVLPLLAGCGWTPRDAFLRNRAVSFSATRGDGSMIASDHAGRSVGDTRIGLTGDR